VGKQKDVESRREIKKIITYVKEITRLKLGVGADMKH